MRWGICGREHGRVGEGDHTWSKPAHSPDGRAHWSNSAQEPPSAAGGGAGGGGGATHSE